MFKDTRNEYAVKTAPTDDPEALQELLNTMSEEGWELYTLHEVESRSGGVQYNCIFFREKEEDEENEQEIIDVNDFKSKMEKMMRSKGEPYEEYKEIQQKIKEKQARISKIKELLDATPSDIERLKLNEEISNCLNEVKDLRNKLAETMAPEKMYEKISQDKISIEISDELIDLVSPEKGAELVAQTVKVRQNLADKLGYVIPAVHFKDSETLEANEYSINVRGIPTLTGYVYPGYRMFYPDRINMDRKPKDGIEDFDSINGEKVYWIPEEKTKDFWEKGFSPEEVIAKNLEYISVKYVDEILDYADVNKYLDLVGVQNIFLIEGLVPDFLSLGDLRYIFASLIREKVPLKDIIYIFERLNDLSQENSKEGIIEELRITLNRHISRSIADENRVIYGITLSDKIIENFEKELLKDPGESITIKGSLIKKASKQIKQFIEESDVPIEHIAIISPISIRQMLFVIFEEIIPGISVISKEEISKEFTLEVIGNVE